MEKDKHALELKVKYEEVTKVTTAKDKAEATINQWKPQYNLATTKMKSTFEYCTEHLEVCRPFRNVLRPFFIEFELDSIESFDAETRDIDKELGTNTPLQDISLDRQTDNVVNVTAAEKHDSGIHNPDDPHFLE